MEENQNQLRAHIYIKWTSLKMLINHEFKVTFFNTQCLWIKANAMLHLSLNLVNMSYTFNIYV